MAAAAPWFLHQLDAAAARAYHIPLAVRLKGKLNHKALRAALDRIVERHEILRTHFICVDGEPFQQIVSPDFGFHLDECDATRMNDAKIRRIAEDEFAAPFHLPSGPLIRGKLLQTATDEHVLLITQHHIISDGWSAGILKREIAALYTAFAQDRNDPLPALAIQYGDYSVWHRNHLNADAGAAQIQFWKEELAGAPAVLELPVDRPRPSVHRRGSTKPLSLSPELTAGLRRLSARHGTTLFMTMLTGWSSLLARLSGQTDIVTGTAVSNRNCPDTEPLIGLFVNTVALRMKLGEEQTVADLLQQAKRTTVAAWEHQDVPFEQVVEAIDPPRSLSHSPVFQVMLTWNNMPSAAGFDLPGLALESVDFVHQATQFDLSLSLTDNQDTITGHSALCNGSVQSRHHRKADSVLRIVADRHDSGRRTTVGSTADTADA